MTNVTISDYVLLDRKELSTLLPFLPNPLLVLKPLKLSACISFSLRRSLNRSAGQLLQETAQKQNC